MVFKPIPEVWGYFSVKGGGGIHEFSDSQVRTVCLGLLLSCWQPIMMA